SGGRREAMTASPFSMGETPFLTRLSWPKKLVVRDGSDSRLNPRAFSADQADAATGHSSPLPSEGPAAADAGPPIKARRESPCRASCDDSEPGATGHPPLSVLNAFMVTAPGRAGPKQKP